jgi:hypothetical protein
VRGVQTIGFVIPTLSTGGAERVVALLADALAADLACIVFTRAGTTPLYSLRAARIVPLDDDLDSLLRAVAAHRVDIRHVPNPVIPDVRDEARHGAGIVLNVSHFRRKANRLDLLHRAVAEARARAPRATSSPASSTLPASLACGAT